MNKTISRILLNIVIIFSVFYFPWWIVALLSLFGVFLFNRFYEIFFIGLFIDMLYGVKADKFYGMWFIFTVIFTIMYILAKRLKKNIRFYDSN